VFRYLSEGKLYKVETEYFDQENRNGRSRMVKPARKVEHFWLCDECASFLTLAFDKSRGMITVPLPNLAGSKKVTRLDVQDFEGDEAERNILVAG
jgi:hypothetical protein